MSTQEVEKEVIWRGNFDEFACVHIQRITRITDGDDEYEKIWRRVITPDDNVNNLQGLLNVGAGVATVLKPIVEAIRVPASVQRYEDRKASNLNPEG